MSTTQILTLICGVSGPRLLTEHSCLGTSDIDDGTGKFDGGDVECVSVLVTVVSGAQMMLTIGTGDAGG